MQGVLEKGRFSFALFKAQYTLNQLISQAILFFQETLIMIFDDIKNIKKDFQLIDDNKLKYKLILYGLIEFFKLKIIIYRRVKKDQAAIMKTIDINSFHKIRKKYIKIAPRANYTKYLNIEEYLPRNLKRAYRLGIHKSKPLNILDIGGGAGYFCLICNFFGHNAETMDTGTSPIFDDLIDAFGIKRKIGKIEPFKSLPRFDAKFDLITSFYVSFNMAASPDEVWGVKKWRFLLQNIAKRLMKKKGRLFYFLHPEIDGKHYDKSLLEFFLYCDAKVFGQELNFENIEKLRVLSQT